VGQQLFDRAAFPTGRFPRHKIRGMTPSDVSTVCVVKALTIWMKLAVNYGRYKELSIDLFASSMEVFYG
jgi:hypothetical protein